MSPETPDGSWKQSATSKRPSPSLVDEPQDVKRVRTQPINTRVYIDTSGYEQCGYLSDHAQRTLSHPNNSLRLRPSGVGTAESPITLASSQWDPSPQANAVDCQGQVDSDVPDWMQFEWSASDKSWLESLLGHENSPQDDPVLPEISEIPDIASCLADQGPAQGWTFQETMAMMNANSLQESQWGGLLDLPTIRNTSTATNESIERIIQGEEMIRAPPPADSSSEACDESFNDYDICFGVVIAPSGSLYVSGNEARFIPVTLEPLEAVLMINDKASGSHVGILHDTKLTSALRRVPLKLDGILRMINAEDVKRGFRSNGKNKHIPKSDSQYNLRIILYGRSEDKETISEILSESEFYLQQPCINEIEPDVKYDNPHYLSGPEPGMPNLEDLCLGGVNDDSKQNDGRNEVDQSQVLRIFEEAVENVTIADAATVWRSPRLRSELLVHQVTALAMMQEKESGFVENPKFPSLWVKEMPDQKSRTARYRHTVTKVVESRPFPVLGGILADDMGLGKTLSVLALICASMDSESATTDSKRNFSGTLIVAPKSTIPNWRSQISEHIHAGQLRVHLYHGPNRECQSNQLSEADITITTYETLRSDWAKNGKTGPLYTKSWLRVVLDEAHRIRNRSKQSFTSASHLTSQYRWCLTGTPIHNTLDDYGALLSFLQCHPFVPKSTFKFWIESPIEKEEPFALDRLKSLIRATCLRRTKEKTLASDQLKLPPRLETLANVNLGKDQSLYDAVKRLTAERAAGLGQNSKKGPSKKTQGDNIVALINYLRLICNHGAYLIPKSVQEKVQSSKGLQADFDITHNSKSRCSNRDNEIGGSLNEETIDQDLICVACVPFGGLPEKQASRVKTANKSDFEKSSYQPSAKVLALLRNLQHEKLAVTTQGRPRKSVVFTFWVKMLDLIEIALEREHFAFKRIDGQSSVEARTSALQEFNSNPECTVMLATTGSCAEGINLTAASTVHLMEPHWNPMQEAQAVDRVYRIGQKDEVNIIRYIIPGSVETYVQYIQESKKRLISQALTNDEVTMADVEASGLTKLIEMI